MCPPMHVFTDIAANRRVHAPLRHRRRQLARSISPVPTAAFEGLVHVRALAFAIRRVPVAAICPTVFRPSTWVPAYGIHAQVIKCGASRKLAKAAPFGVARALRSRAELDGRRGQPSADAHLQTTRIQSRRHAEHVDVPGRRPRRAILSSPPLVSPRHAVKVLANYHEKPPSAISTAPWFTSFLVPAMAISQ